MDDILRNLAKRSAVTVEPGDYIQDGLLYCGHCRTQKQCKIEIEKDVLVVDCMCACAERTYEAEKKAELDREARMRVDSLRVQGIQDRNMRRYTFSSANTTPNLEKCRKYVDRWGEMLESNAGLLFWGGAGTGKTYAAACIANALIDRGIPALMTSFPRILGAGWDKAEIVEQMHSFPLLVMDDLGAERESSYALETVHMVVDERYKAGLPLIVTTNLTLDEMKKPKNMDFWRIYDRIMEMCVPVMFKGASKRTERAAAKLLAIEELFR